MLPITGYADRWSVRSGDDINFMIAVKGGGRYSARIARIICGDPIRGDQAIARFRSSGTWKASTMASSRPSPRAHGSMYQR